MRAMPGVDRDELRRLAATEAAGYQSFAGWHPVAAQDPVAGDIRHALHEPAWAAARAAVRERVEPAGWDGVRQRATDIPDLVPCWRVAVVADNPTFPPLVRVRAYRALLPDELAEQVDAWRRWAGEVAAGRHDPYLMKLHWYATADWARYHWEALHRAAVESLAAVGAWASNSELVAVRDDILRLPRPEVPRIGIAGPDTPSPDRDRLAVEYPAALAAARTLAELTRRWDGCVRGNRKLRLYEDGYHLTLDEFRRLAAGGWLHEFFAWADRCVTKGFGWCLDP
jgi:hypothetical protein